MLPETCIKRSNMVSIFIKRASINTTEDEVRFAFKNYPVERVDIVTMKDYYGVNFLNIFVHFTANTKAMALYNDAKTNHVTMGEWVILPNFAPIKRSLRIWTPEELAQFERFKKETAKQMK